MAEPHDTAHEHSKTTAHMCDPDEIIPRDLRFDIMGNAQKHWLDDDIIKTILIDGLSISCPRASASSSAR